MKTTRRILDPGKFRRLLSGWVLTLLTFGLGSSGSFASNLPASFAIELPSLEPDVMQPNGIWRLERDAKVDQHDAEPMVSLPGKRDAVTFNSPDIDLGYSWGADPFGDFFLRPGSAISLSFSVANEGDKGTLYVRPAHASNGNGLASFQGSPKFVTTIENSFVERIVCATLSATTVAGKRIGVLFLNAEENPVRLLPPKRIQALHPLLGVRGLDQPVTASIEKNQPFLSEEFAVFNAQEQVFEEVLSSDEGPTTISTLLFGTADLKATPRDDGDHDLTFGNSVGVVLMGKHADLFSFESSHATEDQKGVVLGMSGEEPGLPGGRDPVEVTFRVKFQGADTPGDFQANIRIVTQAVNHGNQSMGNAGEPGYGLFYKDIPVSVTVK